MNSQQALLYLRSNATVSGGRLYFNNELMAREALASLTIPPDTTEHVVWMQIDENGKSTNLFFNSVPNDYYHTYEPLYTTPQAPTLDQARAICEANGFAVVKFDVSKEPLETIRQHSDWHHAQIDKLKIMLEAAKEVK